MQLVMDAHDFERQFLGSRHDLLGFLFRMTGNLQDAEDLLQDSYLKARERLESFEARSTVKTWVFSIASNLARDHHRARRRWREDAQDRCRERTKASSERVEEMRRQVKNSPADRYEFKEHIDYCFTCIAKTLEIEQQLCVLLKDVYGFKVAEIVDILALSEGKVKHALANGRRTMVRIFDDRCVLVSKKGVCHQCSEIAGFVNPEHDEQIQKAEQQLTQAAADGADFQRLYEIRAELVRGVDPLTAPGAGLHTYLLELIDEWPKQEVSPCTARLFRATPIRDQ